VWPKGSFDLVEITMARSMATVHHWKKDVFQRCSPRYWAHHGIGEVLGRAQPSFLFQGEKGQVACRREGNIEERERRFGSQAEYSEEAASRHQTQ